MIQWEYATTVGTNEIGTTAEQEKLLGYGECGWELCGPPIPHYNNWIYYWKRPTEQ